MILKKDLNIEVERKSSFSSIQFSHSVVPNSLPPHGLQHARLPSPSPTPGVYSNSCPLSRWCHPTISSSVVPFSSCLQSFPASGSFPMSQFFASVGQRTGVSSSTSVLGAITNSILKSYIHKNSIMEVKWNHTKCPVNPKAKLLDTAKEKSNKLENRI